MNEEIFIHPSSINDGATIGTGTRIWHFCHISKGAFIGKNCTIGDYVYIGPNVIIGDNCRIQNNVQIFEGVDIDHDVFIGPGVIFTNVRRPIPGLRGKLEITYVKANAMIGAGSMIRCGAVIGAYTVIGMGSVVLNNVPNYSTVVGNPAKEVK